MACAKMPAYKAADAPSRLLYGRESRTAHAPATSKPNTSDLPGRPKWAMELLTLHEAVPGHHLQIALAQEVQDLPETRKHAFYTSFTEGLGGFMRKSLGPELGMYKDPYARYGQLCRLKFGARYGSWSIREFTTKGLDAASRPLITSMPICPKRKRKTENEVDRYITWPGQALAYKVGQLKIRELRARAETELGDKFNVREFHDQVLKHGSLPMDVLEKTVGDWIDSQKKEK